MKRYVEARLGKHIESAEKLRKFLHNDRKVLRFEGEWDDSASVYGDRNAYILQFYLANDTVDVREVRGRCYCCAFCLGRGCLCWQCRDTCTAFVWRPERFASCCGAARLRGAPARRRRGSGDDCHVMCCVRSLLGFLL